MTPRIIPIPEGPYCRGIGYECKYYEGFDIVLPAWCSYYEAELEDDRKCPRCAHPEI